jgi:four helix bundle protein
VDEKYMQEFSYKQLEVWKKSVELIKEIYKLSEKFPKSEEYNLKLQIRRAVISVALNIAEGKSRKGAKEFSNFINISYGSLYEVEAILTLSQELGYLNNISSIYSQIETLAKMLNSLRKSLKESYE